MERDLVLSHVYTVWSKDNWTIIKLHTTTRITSIIKDNLEFYKNSHITG